MTGFGDQLRNLRETRSLTQEELAERAGLTVKAVGALERGERRRPYPHTVRSLADALGLGEAERAALVSSVPGRSGAAPPPVAASAPRPASGLVGREDDVEHVAELLLSGHRRVVTLTGPGGVGKTTLARAAAARAAGGYPSPPVWVELAGVTDPAGVLPAVAAAFGVPEQDFDGSPPRLAAYLAGRRVLVVLDNLEQVLDAAADIAALVQLCPDLAVLGTSRAPLRVRAEQEVRVAPLAVPTGADDVAASPAVQLFLDRAAAVGAGVALAEDGPTVAELCRRLEGIPLALELAAGVTGLLAPGTLLDRLHDLPPTAPRDLPDRQRTMEATLDWSWRLLSEEEQRLLAGLSVFLGTFSLAGADAVLGGDALPLLGRLADHSWVVRAPDVAGTERFRLLVPLRQYAEARLADHERGQVLGRVATQLLETVRDLADDLRGARLGPALDLLEAEVPTVRSVVGWLLAERRTDVAGELLWRLWLHLALRGHAREGLAWCAGLRELPAGDAARAQWLTAAAGLSYVSGDIPAVRRDAEAALASARLAGRRDVEGEAGVLAGSGALFSGDLARAGELLAAARTVADETGERWARAHTVMAQGQVALLAGDLAEAERLMAEVEADARAIGNPFTLATALNVRATMTELREQHASSAALLAEAAELSVAASMSWTFAYVLPALAGVAVRLGEEELGARLFGASASYSAQHSVATTFQPTRQLADRDLARARELLGDDAFRRAWDAGRDATPEDVVALAHDLSRRAQR